jgi:hypothetical protein
MTEEEATAEVNRKIAISLVWFCPLTKVSCRRDCVCYREVSMVAFDKDRYYVSDRYCTFANRR